MFLIALDCNQKQEKSSILHVIQRSLTHVDMWCGWSSDSEQLERAPEATVIT